MGSFGHTKVGGYPVRLRGLSPLVATVSTPIAAPVIAGIRRPVLVTVAMNASIRVAIAGIGEDAWTPVHYPAAVTDPDTGELISDAEVAECVYTAFAGTKHEVTARLVVRRVKDKNSASALFPVWRHHAFLTDTTLSTVDADVTLCRSKSHHRSVPAHPSQAGSMLR